MGPYVEPARTPWVRMWKKRRASSCKAADGDSVLAFNPNLRARAVC